MRKATILLIESKWKNNIAVEKTYNLYTTDVILPPKL